MIRGASYGVGIRIIVILDIQFARTATLVDIGERVSAGLSLAPLEHAQSVIAPGDNAFRRRIISPSSLKRRKASNQLSAAESQRLSRTARIWAAALDAYSDKNQVRRFIGKPHLSYEIATAAAVPGWDRPLPEPSREYGTQWALEQRSAIL